LGGSNDYRNSGSGISEIFTYPDAVELKINTIFQTLIASGVDFDGERIKARYRGTDIEKPKMFLEVFKKHNTKFEKLVDKALMSFRMLQKFRTVKHDVSAFLKYQYNWNDIEVNSIEIIIIV
jgi:hypothetical protein